MSESEFSDYVVYVDESGDPNLKKINPNFPVFVLTLCVFPCGSTMTYHGYRKAKSLQSIRRLSAGWVNPRPICLHCSTFDI